MSYDQINDRNGFLMLKLVEYDFFITLRAQKLGILKMSEILTVAILDCLLPYDLIQDVCLCHMDYLGSLLWGKIIRTWGPLWYMHRKIA